MPVTRITPKTRKRGQELRNEMTPPERKLWTQLKVLKEQGLKFRRQAPIGPYIADFVCFTEKLVVELDGDSHGSNESQMHDSVRDEFLQQQGFQVLRIPNSEVNRNLNGVVETILSELKNDSA
ncbi:hypothetical protein MNBD_ALPHA08-1185 [hydrothermal vent metagenome]|uniref:DUF559 domain-containing protein n=1 Tax=hydrothermal vent metagenome TaxID=652676 RepID=A0A3B0RJ29_9ZZZZ